MYTQFLFFQPTISQVPAKRTMPRKLVSPYVQVEVWDDWEVSARKIEVSMGKPQENHRKTIENMGNMLYGGFQLGKFWNEMGHFPATPSLITRGYIQDPQNQVKYGSFTQLTNADRTKCLLKITKFQKIKGLRLPSKITDKMSIQMACHHIPYWMAS